MLNFILGLFIGVAAGVFIMALLSANNDKE